MSDQFGRSFQKTLSRMGTLRQKLDRRSKALPAVSAVELPHSDAQFDRARSNWQVHDPFAIATLLDGIASLAAMRANPDWVLRNHGETIPIVRAILLRIDHNKSRQIEQLRPKIQPVRACHGNSPKNHSGTLA